MIGKKRLVKILDPKLCFDLWIETGSVYKVPALLHSRHGVFNVKLGQEVSHMGVWSAAWKYVLENLVECRPRIAETWRANGELLTDQKWYEMVCEKAKLVKSKNGYEQYIKDHLYLTPYQK